MSSSLRSSLARFFGVICLALPSCEPGPEPTEGRENVDEDSDAAAAGTVQAAADTSCSTASVQGLSKQIIEEVNCVAPNTYAAIPNRGNLVAAAHVSRFLQKPARDALVSALDAKPNTTMTLNSALRTPAQQYLLSQWGDDGVCGVELAAPPGSSNHEGGLALDIDQFSTWRSALETRGFVWFGPSDDVHYDYVGSGATDTRFLGVQAFQRLWNRNNPNDLVSEDGDFGGATADRMGKAPAGGFKIGAVCGSTLPAAPIEVYWNRQSTGSYELRALAPAAITRVEYRVDGFLIGSAPKSAGANFPDAYTFTTEDTERSFEVLGFDASNKLSGRGIGLIDVVPGTAVYIRQLGAQLYEMGLERAPAQVATVQLTVDGIVITDSVSGQAKTSRLAVRHKYSKLGKRSFALSTFNADGSKRGTIKRTFTLE